MQNIMMSGSQLLLTQIKLKMAENNEESMRMLIPSFSPPAIILLVHRCPQFPLAGDHQMASSGNLNMNDFSYPVLLYCYSISDLHYR